MTYVKICGIRTLKDAITACDLGADALGYNFYSKSKRYLSPATAAEIQGELSRRGYRVTGVGVFVNASSAEICEIIADCNLGYAQLSGDETTEFAHSLPMPWFKAIRPQTDEDAHAQSLTFSRPNQRPALLVDAYRPGEYGGTGHTGDWALAQTLAAQDPLYLAGGLTPDNVRQAIAQVRPWGVDVASGVESAPGVKDAAKMKRFIEEAKSTRLV